MFSFHKKRILSYFFTLLVLVPTFFMVPAVFHFGSSTAYACGWSDPEDCISVVAKFFFVDIPRALFLFVAPIFDALIAFSLSSTVIKSPEFVDKGWVIMRDLSNTFFIFILLYIAISTILQTAGGQTKKLLATLIMVALLMNFSLYITRFVIDIGNVFALEFYNNLGDEVISPIITITGIKQRSIGDGIGESFKTDAQVTRADAEKTIGEKVFIYFMMGILIFILCGILFSVAMLFLARVVAFWLLMILSPLAFFSMILPFTKGKIWSPWFSQLISQTFFAPIFFFFLYLTLILTKTLNGAPGSSVNSLFGGPADGVGAMLYMFLKFFAIIAILLYGLKTAKGMSGEIGASMTNMGKKAGGLAGLGIGAGLTGVAGFGRFAGGGVAKLAVDKYEAGMEKSWGGRMALKGLKGVASGSFDARNLPGMKTITGELASRSGVNINMGQNFGKGGKLASEAAKSEEMMKEYKRLKERNPAAAADYLERAQKTFGVAWGGKAATSDAIGSMSTSERNKLIAALPKTPKGEKQREEMENMRKIVEGRETETQKELRIKAEKREKIKTLQEEKQLKQEERVENLKTVIENFKTGARTDVAKGTEEVNELVKPMTEKEVGELDFSILNHEMMLPRVNVKHIERWEKDGNLTSEEKEDLYAKLKAKGSDKVKEHLEDRKHADPKESAKERIKRIRESGKK